MFNAMGTAIKTETQNRQSARERGEPVCEQQSLGVAGNHDDDSSAAHGDNDMDRAALMGEGFAYFRYHYVIFGEHWICRGSSNCHLWWRTRGIRNQ
jgi:hypothetical protein